MHYYVVDLFQRFVMQCALTHKTESLSDIYDM